MPIVALPTVFPSPIPDPLVAALAPSSTTPVDIVCSKVDTPDTLVNDLVSDLVSCTHPFSVSAVLDEAALLSLPPFCCCSRSLLTFTHDDADDDADDGDDDNDDDGALCC